MLQSVTPATLTELLKLSSSNIRVYISGRIKDERRAKAKTDSNASTVGTLVGSAKKVKASTLAAENHHANLTCVEDYDYYYDEDLDEPANTYQAHNDPIDPASDDGEEARDYDDDEENDTLSSFIALDDVTVYEAAALEAIVLLADTWNDDLDPEASAQFVQASAPAYLTYGKDRGKGKGKRTRKGKGRYPVRPSHLSLEDRRRLGELKAETECRACGRNGHWANDHECAMSSSNSSTQIQIPSGQKES